MGEGTLAVGGVEVLDEGGEGVEFGGGSVPRLELAGGEGEGGRGEVTSRPEPPWGLPLGGG